MTTAHDTARVCVSASEHRRVQNGERSEPQDGAASPPRGRGLRPRRFRLPTTT